MKGGVVLANAGSVARLDRGFYDQPLDPELIHARAGKEALHEQGHTWGLTHCPDQHCIMSLACAIGRIDGNHEELCQSCAGLGPGNAPGLAASRRWQGEST